MGSHPLPVAVLGASGTTGGELVRLLAGHPGIAVAHLAARGSAGRTLAEVHPHLAWTSGSDRPLHSVEDVAAVADAAEVAFLALPHGASSELAPALLESGVRVVDLAGDFRLGADRYPVWYGFEHPAPAWLDKSVYGLPELFAADIASASLVANPGCFPTPVVLGLAPLLSAGLIDPSPIHVDGKTGLSGAGNARSAETSYATTEESVRPYRAPRHQHTPEMEDLLGRVTGASVSISFVPHLVPAVRGVLTTCYARLAAAATTEELTAALASAYVDAPFVRVLDPGSMVDTKRVRGSNVVELQALADPRTGTAVVVGAVDNLVKGAAGQAIQNLNVVAGFDQTLGLPLAGVYP